MKIIENKKVKALKSEDYNYIFFKNNGLFLRWGKTKKEDPDYSKYGPELADIEISTICSGLGKPCPWCYKSNTSKGKNMLLPQFKKVFEKLPKTITQIAFGIGDIDSNPDMFKIFKFCRDKGVIPNVTINGFGLTNKIAKKLFNFCGAVAVSHYDDKICFDAIKKLTDLGMKQINIHKLLAKETLNSCFDLIEKIKKDERLKKLNAVVFLSLKPKGKRNNFTQLSQGEFNKLTYKLLENKINYGFDSCSANKFLNSVKGHKNYEVFKTYIEPCESSRFSIYINVDSEVFPCSFCEDIIKPTSLEDFWNKKEIVSFRKKLLKYNDNNGCVKCPVYKI